MGRKNIPDPSIQDEAINKLIHEVWIDGYRADCKKKFMKRITAKKSIDNVFMDKICMEVIESYTKNDIPGFYIVEDILELFNIYIDLTKKTTNRC